jgi:hypothetical protein
VVHQACLVERLCHTAESGLHVWLPATGKL